LELTADGAAPPARIGRRLLAFNLLLLALVAALVAWTQSSSRRNFVGRAQVATENLAEALAVSIRTELQRTDLGLRNVALDIAQAGPDPTEARVDSLLREQLALLPQLESIRIAGADGVVRHGLRAAEPKDASVAHRDFFVRARSAGQALPVVSGPLRSPVTERWVVVVARPLRGAGQADFEGVVFASIEVERFLRLIDGFALGRQGAMTVRGDRLALVARRVEGEATPSPVGTSNVSAQLREAIASQPDAGVFLARTALDGIERANAYRRVEGTPLLVLVGLATDDFLDPWRTQTRQSIAVAALAMLLIAAASLLLQRAWQRESRSAHALIREGQRHRALLRSASDGMHVVDRAGRLVEMSDSFAAMLGHRREDLLMKHVSFWDALNSREEIDRRLREFRVGEEVRFGSRHRCADGRLIDVEVMSLGLRIDGEELLYCSSRDVTERRAQARELEGYRDHLELLVAERTERWRASELRFRALVEQSLVGVYVQVNDRYRFVNAAFAAIFGYERPEDMTDGRLRAHTLIAPEERERVNEVSRRVITGGEPMTRLEFTGLRRDGRRVTLETYASPIDDPDGPAAIGLLLDVTAQRRAEAERAEALARETGLRAAAEAQARSLRELLDQREEFIRVLAHEVRQPLNNASAALQSATAGLGDADGAAECIARAQAVIGQIVASLDNTLAATTVLASHTPLDARDADVGTLIDLGLGDLHPLQRVRVRVQRDSPTRTASMDIGLMRLALRNVLGNALTYSPADSEVVLRVVDSDDPLALVFEVADHGSGIAPELRPRLFERGARGAHGMPGHGIGLHVVRRVMELHGGSVDVRANTPRGSVFRLWLPQGQ